ncbi:hypothetical protein G6F37_007946 [Rhizopus arrhizus]|nr:hypothetical protein G6F38_008086 [Rhizopus arrhizus]KAG1156072.1 hypothetical protein G6F37_007946 [Rhizopus arrhizus]
MAEAAFAQHLLSSVRSELDLLKKFNYIQPKAYDEILRLLPTTTTTISQLGYAEALYDFTGSNPSADLNFRAGDKIQIVEYVNDNWWKGTLNGKTGQPSSGPSPALPSRKAERDNYSMPTGQSYPTPSYSPMTPASTYPPPPQQQQPPQYPPPQQYAPPPPQQPYSTPPPPQYAPPPAAGQYAPPPAANQYAPPASAPVVAAPQASAPGAAPHEESKVAGFGKQLAGNVANAATWGFGATIGSDIAHSIF